MARSFNAQLLLFAALLAVGAITTRAEGLPPLPAFKALPAACGSVTQVKPDDTCETVAEFAGISLAKLKELNPFVMCGAISLLPGSPVCIGDPMAYCNNIYVADSSDTCKSIATEVGDITNINGKEDTDCAALKAMEDVPVCISPDVKKCAKPQICGVAISDELQALLASQTDFCDILSECQGEVQLTELEGKPSLALKLTSKTPAIKSALGNPGHPDLTTFAAAIDAGNAAQLTVTITPNWFADGAGLTSTDMITGESQTAGKRLRKVLAGTWVRRTYGRAYIPPRVPYRYY